MINHTYNANSPFSVVLQYLLGILLEYGDPPVPGGADLACRGALVPPAARLTIAEAPIIGRGGGVDDLQVDIIMPVLGATAVMMINQRLKIYQFNAIQS